MECGHAVRRNNGQDGVGAAWKSASFIILSEIVAVGNEGTAQEMRSW